MDFLGLALELGGLLRVEGGGRLSCLQSSMSSLDNLGFGLDVGYGIVIFQTSESSRKRLEWKSRCLKLDEELGGDKTRDLQEPDGANIIYDRR
jgi:hypothetical protein